MKKNIVFIMVDQMRSDCLGIKNSSIETPILDMMVKHGFLFDKTYSAVPSCIAARASILTGLSPKTHGRVGYMDSIPWNYKNYLAEVFSNNGYHTQCIGKMHVYPERSLCGFHNILLHDGYLHNSRNFEKPFKSQFYCTDDYLYWLKEKKGIDFDINDNGLECNSWVARPWMYEENLHPTNWVVAEGINFLRKKDPTKPFFLTLSFVRPHSPLDPPKYYFDMYKDSEIENPYIGDWEDINYSNDDGLDINCIQGKISEKALKRAKAAYYGSITHIDSQIGRFLQALTEHNCLDNTLIVFLSDHGDLLGDHNFFRKGLPYEGSSKVPFIIYAPSNILNIKTNKIFNELVELRDIMPTLLDLCDLSIPSTVEGKSVKKIMFNKGKIHDYIHGEHSLGDLSNQFIVTKDYKYIWFSKTGKEQLFNLKDDEKELYNLSNVPKYNNILTILRNYLIYELKDREEGYVKNNKLIPDKTPKSVLNKTLS